MVLLLFFIFLVIIIADGEGNCVDFYLYYYFKNTAKRFPEHPFPLGTLAVDSRVPVFIRLKKNEPLSPVQVRMIIFSINKKRFHKKYLTGQNFDFCKTL